jgi:hypothetical protein
MVRGDESGCDYSVWVIIEKGVVILFLEPMKISVDTLDKVDLEAAASIYAQGILMEKPPGSQEPLGDVVRGMRQHLQRHLRRRTTRQVWVAKRNGSPCGILDFDQKDQRIHIRFICGIPPRHGIGTQLMAHLAKYATTHKVPLISTTVSTLDTRAMRFYFQHLGYQRAGLTNQKIGFDLYYAIIDTELLLQRVKRTD